VEAPLAAAAISLALAATPAIAEDDWVLRPAERHMWARTTRADTVQAYEEYLSLFWRDGKHVAEALARWVDLTHRGDPKALQLPPKGRWRAT
jgi:phytoene dehydrogenase-like protein